MATQAAESVAPSTVEIGQLYFGLHHRIHRLVDEAMNAAGLSLSRAKVLGVLAECGPVKQATVACKLGFAPRSVTDTLDALEREGLATRGPDPNDRRAWLVEITPAGRTALEQALDGQAGGDGLDLRRARRAGAPAPGRLPRRDPRPDSTRPRKQDMSSKTTADLKAAEARSSDHRWLILVVVSIAQLMVVLDATVVNIALPSAQARPRLRRQPAAVDRHRLRPGLRQPAAARRTRR